MRRLRALGIVAGALALAAGSASFALVRVTERRQPMVAAALPMTSGFALAGHADLILAANMTRGRDPKLALDTRERAQALALSREAYASEPLAINAVRNVALIADADGDLKTARILMRHAQTITRRDLATNGWLIRDYGELGQLEPALATFDYALRTSSTGQRMLLPALFNAMGAADVEPPLIALLRDDPPWADAFWREAPKHRGALASVARIRAALAKEGMAGDFSHDLSLLRALTSAEDFVSAERLFDAVAEAPRPADNLLRNGDFERTSRFEPFDWRLLFDGSTAADVSPVNSSLRVQTFADGSGTVARQLVRLAPGRYRVESVAREWDALDSRAVSVRVRCAESDGAASWTFPVDRPRFSVELALGGGCRYHWVELRANPQPQRQDNAVIFDSVKLSRIAPA